jgi:hypothetical protein
VFVLLESGTRYPFSSFPSEFCTNLFLGGEWFPSLFHLPIIPLGALSVPDLLVCISQAGLELASSGAEVLLFSQCNVMWRSFVQAGGLGCQSFASWWVFSAMCGCSVSAIFLICRAQAVCFLPLVAILDPPQHWGSGGNETE